VSCSHRISVPLQPETEYRLFLISILCYCIGAQEVHLVKMSIVALGEDTHLPPEERQATLRTDLAQMLVFFLCSTTEMCKKAVDPTLMLDTAESKQSDRGTLDQCNLLVPWYRRLSLITASSTLTQRLSLLDGNS